MPVPTNEPPEGAPRLKADGAAPSAAIVTWSLAELPAPFVAVTSFVPGDPNGVPVPSKV